MKSTLTLLAMLIAATSAVSTLLPLVGSTSLTILKAPVANHRPDDPSTAVNPAITADQQAHILRRCHRGHSHGGLEVPLYCPNGVDDVVEDEEEMVVKRNHNGLIHVQGVGNVAEDEQATTVRRNHNGVIHVEGVDAAEMPDDLVIVKRVAKPSHEGQENGVAI